MVETQTLLSLSTAMVLVNCEPICLIRDSLKAISLKCPFVSLYNRPSAEYAQISPFGAFLNPVKNSFSCSKATFRKSNPSKTTNPSLPENQILPWLSSMEA